MEDTVGNFRWHFTRVSAEPLLDLRAVPWSFAEQPSRPTIIFPTVVDTRTLSIALPQPLDRYYLFYAPHHSRAMGLATASLPEGPWTPYAGNPFLRLEDVPGLRGHISSPEIVYRPDRPAAPFWLYFHGLALPRGGGQQTCLATSRDLLHWTLVSPDPILTATEEQTGDENTAAYVRVFRYGDWWYGLYKAEKAHGLARSPDGITWEHWPHNPLIRPEAAEDEYDRIRHTAILLADDTLHFLYSTLTRPDLSREEIKLAFLPLHGRDWLEWGPLERRGAVFRPELPWESGDVRDPFLLVQDDALYLYYVGGHEQGIGLAKATLH
ncbi:MAG TPA: hypothetical protein VIU62_10140 [Chloroflexota bacterium]